MRPYIETDTDDPCLCQYEDNEEPKGVVINHDPIWHDGHVIHDPSKGGCGKFIRFYDAG